MKRDLGSRSHGIVYVWNRVLVYLNMINGLYNLYRQGLGVLAIELYGLDEALGSKKIG